MSFGWVLWVISFSTPSFFSFFPLPVFHLLAVSACCSEFYLVLHRLVAKTSLSSPPWPEVKLPDPVEEAKYHAGKSLRSGLPAFPWGLIEHKCLQLEVCVLHFFFFHFSHILMSLELCSTKIVLKPAFQVWEIWVQYDFSLVYGSLSHSQRNLTWCDVWHETMY